MASGTSPRSIAVAILFMPGEETDTLNLVDALLTMTGPDDHIFVHQNGGTRDQLLDRLATTGVEVSWSDENLGAGGGRNLLTELPGFREHDLALFIDNDIVATQDLLDSLREASEALHARPDTGIIGIPAYGYPRLIRRQYDDLFITRPGPLESNAQVFDSETFLARNRLAQNPMRPSNAGANPDWKMAYFSILPSIAQSADGVDGYFANNAKRHDYWSHAAKHEYIECSSIPAFCACVPMSLLGERPFPDQYRPFGSEDVAFALALQRTGYRHFMISRHALPHGTHARHYLRKRRGQALVESVNRYRAHRLLSETSLGPLEAASSTATRMLGDMVLAHAQGRQLSDRDLWAMLTGLDIAEQQLISQEAATWKISLGVDLATLNPAKYGGTPPSTDPRPTLMIFLEQRQKFAEELRKREHEGIETLANQVADSLLEQRQTLRADLTASLLSGVDQLDRLTANP